MLNNKELEDHYSEMLERVESFYKKGFYEWVETENPYVAKRLVVIDEKINEVWNQCIEGQSDFLMFKAGVKLYEDTVRKAMAEYA